jgi:type IV secretion system pilin
MRLTRSPRKPRSDRRPTTPRPSQGPGAHHATASPRGRLARSCASRPTDEQAATPPISGGLVGGRRTVRRRLVVITELAVLVLLVSASAAHAETTQVLALAGSVDQVLTNIRNWVMGILAGLATVFLSVGGVRYVMGGGDPGEIEKAKTSFKAAGIGYALAALAPLVVTVLQGIVGA